MTASTRVSASMVPQGHLRWWRKPLTRATALVGAALLMLAALWSGRVHELPWPWSGEQEPTSAAEIASPPTQPEVPVTANAVIPDTPAGTDSSVSKVPLRLILASTAPGRNAFEGTAAIGVTRESTQTYLAGAILENGARLAEIHADHVVLERDDRRVKLYVENPLGKPLTVAQADPLAVVGAQPERKTEPRLDVDVVSDHIRLAPVYEEDAVVGLQAYPGAKPAAFRSWGLESGDVLTAIDGAPVMDADQALTQLRLLSEGVAVVATVRRNGHYTQVTLDGTAMQPPPPVDLPLSMP